MEYKRAVEDKYLGPLIKTSMTRCIHCTRCIRFFEQIAGEFSLGQVGRGKKNEISGYIENMMTNELSGNVVDLCPVGALNNAPYSFQARPWELKHHYTTDVLDGVGANIEVHTRGSDTMRILPRINDEVNEEWISDKSRHAFDGLKKQRLTLPMLRKEDGSFKELRWEEAIAIARDKLSAAKGDEICGMIGPFMDLETLVVFKDLLNRLNCENYDVRTNAPKLGSDFRSKYLMNSRIMGVDDADLLLLVGCNPRTEAPVLNARIRKAINLNGLEVYVVGSAPDISYDYTHLGNSPLTLTHIAQGDHPFCQRLSKAELPMVLVGSRALERSDGDAILNTINKIAEGTNVINKELNWNGIGVLHNEQGKVGQLELGMNSNPQYLEKNKPKVVYLLGADDLRPEEIPEDAFVIYQGHTGDEGAYYADLILPGASYLEKQATYVNMEGRPQRARAATSPPGFAREDWMILRALSEELQIQLPYDSLDEIRTRIAELAPHLLKFDFVEPFGFEDLAHKPGQAMKLNSTPFTDNIDNFYMDDAISRQSQVMARCTKELNPKKQFNFRSLYYS